MVPMNMALPAQTSLYSGRSQPSQVLLCTERSASRVQAGVNRGGTHQTEPTQTVVGMQEIRVCVGMFTEAASFTLTAQVEEPVAFRIRVLVRCAQFQR